MSLPHARGGVSEVDLNPKVANRSSPRPWGCFFLSAHILRPAPVFPTPVGVFLVRRGKKKETRCLPHARGGVSIPGYRPAGDAQSSPRPWGCFCQTTRHLFCMKVFPTPVGVFLASTLAVWV